MTQEVIFKFNGAKARDLVKAHGANETNDYATLCEFVAKYAAGCPEEWGEPNSVETYMDSPFMDVTKPAIAAFFGWDGEPKPIKAEFNTAAVTGRVMQRLMKVRASDVSSMAEILEKVVTSLAVDGKVVKVKSDDLLDMGVEEFRAVWRMFLEELSGKN